MASSVIASAWSSIPDRRSPLWDHDQACGHGFGILATNMHVIIGILVIARAEAATYYASPWHSAFHEWTKRKAVSHKLMATHNTCWVAAAPTTQLRLAVRAGYCISKDLCLTLACMFVDFSTAPKHKIHARHINMKNNYTAIGIAKMVDTLVSALHDEKKMYMHLDISTCIYACIYMHTSTCIYAFRYIYMHICMCLSWATYFHDVPTSEQRG